MTKPSRLEKRRRDHIAEREKRHRRRNDKERDSPEPGVQPVPDERGARGIGRGSRQD
jgi:hypothetical protein